MREGTTYMNWNGTINGKQVEMEVPATERMVTILRDRLLLTGTKISCEIGRCGACMILLGGEPVNSCLLMAYQCAGQEIQTIEGLAPSNETDLHPVQQAFIDEGGFQCGYCTPGMILCTTKLLEQHPNPSTEQIEKALCGNLCRCTGYSGIIRAVQQAAAASRAEHE
ncbi:(2Fe-2S)-binding protein [Paenibacillus sp. J45TS6]|uniref:(2Fe-2S)-binding protein n=1 Tax=Paenibacillus sp. J45TS6 TaxID=2807196 RepID=UPI001B0FCCC6|nr:(2Fe-2S)-binding protein [Paenibacillus sp. J45TS6]GIP42677.1 (2Fe-2S)-binding protein [Paenibacillus sp. J45TS6]